MSSEEDERAIGQCASCTREITEGHVYVELDQMRDGEKIGTLTIHNACLLANLEEHV